VLVIRLRWVPFIDITGLQTLEEVVRDLQRRGVRVMLAGANARVHGKLLRAGLVELVGRGNCFSAFVDALAACRRLAESDPARAHERAMRVSHSAESGPGSP
jgi:SulP family sulfate permease